MKVKTILNKHSVKKVLNMLLKLLTDEQVVKIQHKLALGSKLNLNTPKRFTEKIQWYKLNYRDPLMTKCADKFLVRDYIKKKGYEDILVNLFQVCDNSSEIDFDKLPNSFVIKSNNGSSTNLFIKNKEKVDFNRIKEQVNSWNIVNTILFGKEWAYYNIEPKIVIEELLVEPENNQSELIDYKFYCFNGFAKFIAVDLNKSTVHNRNFYDLNWNLLDVETKLPKRVKSKHSVSKPDGFNYMLEIANSIAKDFPFVRVDFYWVNRKVYFGETTFYPWSGCVKFTPDNFDYEIGNYFTLPKRFF